MPVTAQMVVLVVEDDWLVRDFIVSHLQDAGWRVLEADSAEQAMAMLKAGEQIDVVITDIELKGAPTGWDVAEAFRAAQPTTHHLCVGKCPRSVTAGAGELVL